MDSPLSPILAEIVTDSLIETIVITLDIRLPIIKTYVDYLFLCLNEGENSRRSPSVQQLSPQTTIPSGGETQQEASLLRRVSDSARKPNVLNRLIKKPIATGRFLNFYFMQHI